MTASTLSLIGTGTCTIDANQPGDPTYLSATQVQQAVAVGAGPQSIAFTSTPPPSPRAGGTYAVTAVATSKLPVSITVDSSTTSVCSISASTVTFLSIGTCRIDANQPGNPSYHAAAQVQQSMTVGWGTQTITFTSTPPEATGAGSTYVVSTAATSQLAVTLTIDRSSRRACVI